MPDQIIDEEVIDGFTKGLLAAKYDNPKPVPPFHKEMWETRLKSWVLLMTSFPLVKLLEELYNYKLNFESH